MARPRRPCPASSTRPSRNKATSRKSSTKACPATEEEEEGHWYFFCFQDSINWLDSSQGAVDQKKLETIGELASGVAHDFNNLIMGIQSNAEAMLAQPSLPPNIRDSLVNIIRACSTGASLTRSLLGYAKRQPLTMAPFNLVDLIQDVARIAGVASGQYRIALGKEFQDPKSPIMLVGSYSSLSHCLLNLIKNAREAMPDGGTVHVLWEGTDTRATVTVRDHGAGISEQDMAHIFEPFFSTKKQGTGLGLAMVRGILAQHSGTVEIRSTVGMGTSVSLVWPRGDVSIRGSAAMPPEKLALDPRRSTHRIFKQTQRMILQAKRQPAESYMLVYVIDDDDLVRDGLCSLLEHLGHRTKSYRYPEMALRELVAAQVTARRGHRGLQHARHERRAAHRRLQHRRGQRAALRRHAHPAHERPAAEPFPGFHVRVLPAEDRHPGKAVQPGDAAAEAGRTSKGNAEIVAAADGVPEVPAPDLDGQRAADGHLHAESGAAQRRDAARKLSSSAAFPGA